MIQVKRSVRYLCCLTRLFILRCSGGSNGYLNLLKRNNIRRNSIKTVPPFLYIICKRKTALAIKAVGTPRGIRTPDLLLRRQLLYPAELLAHIPCLRICRRVCPVLLHPLVLPGAGEGNRTLVSSLEGWCSTIELHPQARLAYHFFRTLSREKIQKTMIVTPLFDRSRSRSCRSAPHRAKALRVASPKMEKSSPQM